MAYLIVNQHSVELIGDVPDRTLKSKSFEDLQVEVHRTMHIIQGNLPLVVFDLFDVLFDFFNDVLALNSRNEF